MTIDDYWRSTTQPIYIEGAMSGYRRSTTQPIATLVADPSTMSYFVTPNLIHFSAIV